MLYRGKVIGPVEKISLKYINEMTPVFSMAMEENYFLYQNLVTWAF